MTSHGNMFGGSLTFDHRSQEWAIFKSRFGQYCTANDVNEDTDKSGAKRRALLLTALAEDTYRVARSLVFPAALDNVEFKELVKKFDAHFESKRSSFAERFKFYKAEQRPGEDLAEWATRVRNLAEHCGFKTELDTMLRDRFVLGLEDVKEKEKLFGQSVETLTFNRALELAQSVRCARQALQVAAPAPAECKDEKTRAYLELALNNARLPACRRLDFNTTEDGVSRNILVERLTEPRGVPVEAEVV